MKVKGLSRTGKCYSIDGCPYKFKTMVGSTKCLCYCKHKISYRKLPGNKPGDIIYEVECDYKHQEER